MYGRDNIINLIFMVKDKNYVNIQVEFTVVSTANYDSHQTVDTIINDCRSGKFASRYIITLPVTTEYTDMYKIIANIEFLLQKNGAYNVISSHYHTLFAEGNHIKTAKYFFEFYLE